MDRGRWDRVQVLFEAAVQRAPATREAFLRGECGGDEVLLAEVLSLIEADDSAEAVLDGAAAIPELNDDVPPGSELEHYRIDERIGQVILRDPSATHRRGPALLNVLRITDIPEAAAVLAPRKLVFLGDEVPAPFQLTTTIYGLHNAAKQIKACGSLPEALEIWNY